MFPAIAVCTALAAAVMFGTSDVVEQRSTHEVPKRPALSPRLLLDLAKRPLWVGAMGVNIAGNILQMVAVHFGALALVRGSGRIAPRRFVPFAAFGARVVTWSVGHRTCSSGRAALLAADRA